MVYGVLLCKTLCRIPARVLRLFYDATFLAIGVLVLTYLLYIFDRYVQQLLNQFKVITHDEKFVRKLGIGGVADTYYKVFKSEQDDGKVVSQIRRHQMQDLDP